MIQFELNKRELKAIRLFVSKDRTRAALESISVELRPEKHPLLIATDGRRIAVLKAYGVYTGTTKETCMIPDSFIGRLLRVMGEKDNTAVMMEITDETITASIPNGIRQNRTYSEPNIPKINCMVFPKWRQVIPAFSKLESYPSREYTLNAEYLADFSRAVAILNGKDSGGLSILSENELGPVVIRPMTCEDFYGVLMPMRGDGHERPISPDWLDLKET